ncbi:HEPN domain-containing protein [Microvirga arabica]|uniref:HEPN domain-containing protein n=1 Tax=Microvirga arabica TaxID=1128671 RepID=UPI001FE51D4D|nr:HEPN domain-containing protein [Microvirga arabica]
MPLPSCSSSAAWDDTHDYGTDSKVLLLSAASYFEKAVCDVIIDTALEAGTRPPFANFIQRQALERKYHSMFDWKASNINSFFALFGPACKEELMKLSKRDGLDDAIRDFVYINSERNKLVHGNFAGFSLEATFEEIWGKFSNAKRVVEWLPHQIKNLCSTSEE